MARWLAIDPGAARIGLAVGDPQTGIATPVTVVAANPQARAFEAICRLAGEYGAEGLVVGWPLNMDGTEGPQGRLARALAGALAKRTRLDVRLWDERLSSFAADQALAGQLTRKKKKAVQDALAAATILEDFFAGDGPRTARRPGEFPNGD